MLSLSNQLYRAARVILMRRQSYFDKLSMIFCFKGALCEKFRLSSLENRLAKN
jgi:hypothetical protein